MESDLPTIPAKHGVALELLKHQLLVVTDPEGGQVCDLVAFRSGDLREWLSNGRTFDYNGTIYLTEGHVLYSNASEAMLTIVSDQVGHHDFLFTACSPEMYRIQYRETGNHSNCLENLTGALAHIGLERHLVPTPFNIFQNSKVMPNGRLEISAPRSKPGQSIVFRAEMNLSIALSACSAPLCNGGSCKPICYEILEQGDANDILRTDG